MYRFISKFDLIVNTLNSNQIAVFETHTRHTRPCTLFFITSPTFFSTYIAFQLAAQTHCPTRQSVSEKLQ